MARSTKSRSERARPRPTSDEAPVACVGIGVSAQSLDSLADLFRTMPTDMGAAFAVGVRHAGGDDPRADVLQQIAGFTSMPVKMGEDGDILQRDHVYVADGGGLMTVEAGRLKVVQTDQPSVDRGVVDSLLVSVAESCQESAIVVVLSGLGSHGATGMAATKSCGGFGLAEASPDGLEPPDQAVSAAGIADLRVPAERIAREIAAYIRTLIATEPSDRAGETMRDEVAQHIARIATILRNATGNDFHGYKHATFLRRIQRRMQVVQAGDIESYIDRLRNDAGEVQHLFQDLLIGVTQFFRDPHEFETLEREVVPRIFADKGHDDRIRVWVLGCATGEEAYSIAILLREHMARMDVAPHVQIFATDIDSRALAVARSGRYPDSIAKQISPERLARWCVKEGATYCVVKELREMCIFSPHNLIKDAPFSRIDLLSCRNLLIYLNSELQDRVMSIFHFSLRAGGYLFLGPAENVTRHQKLFAPVDRKNRIFRRLETTTRVLPDFPLSPRSDRPDASGETAWRTPAPRALSGRVGRRVEQVTERYAPAYIVVDENYDVLHFSGRTGRFLEPSSGAANLNLLNLVHRDLRLDLRAALHEANSQGQTAEARNVRLGSNGEARAVSLVVEPIAPAADEARAFVVLFQDSGPAVDGAGGADASVTTDEHVLRLEAELRVTKERLQTTIEELQTVNGELAHRVSDLGRANSDLKNLLESTQIATIFLDNDLRLRSFTPACSEVFHVIETDVGRPIGHIHARVAYPELQDDARKVLKSLGQVEREVASSEEDRQFLVRVLPYRSVDNFIAGVVVTFLEITGTARAEAALRASERRFGEAQQLAGIGVWEWNLETDETWWSPVTYQLWSVPVGEQPPPVSERPIHPEDRKAYEDALVRARETGALNLEWRVVLPDRSTRWLASTGRMERFERGRRMLGVTQDITERKQTETRLKLLLGELQHRVRNILGVVRSIVGRTVRSATSVEELASHLDGRLDTLARTQGVFTRSGDAAVGLEEMVRDEMLSVAAREEQITVEGPTLRLRREAAETFALALHELTTNAVKYGALARPDGKVSVRWRIVHASSGPRLSLEWQESGVPALNTSPARSGFGRELIERGLPYELGATTALEFGRGGVRALIELPLTEKLAVLDRLNLRVAE